MRSLRSALAVILAALLCTLSLVSCQHTLEVGEQGIYDEKNNVHYMYAAPVYEAVSKDEAFGTLKLNENVSIELFTIPNTDPAQMLANEDLNILHATTVTMPTLTEMEPKTVHICIDGSDKAYELFAIDDAEDVRTLVKICEEGESLFEHYPATTPTKNYRVRFSSEKYPGMYYTLTYVEYASDVEIDGESFGRRFFLHTTAKIFIPAGDIIHHASGAGSEADDSVSEAD